MKYSGLYFIPNTGNSLEASQQIVSTLVNGIESQFPFATRQPTWNLQHRLIRSVPPLPTKTYDDDDDDGPRAQPPAPPPTSYQHLLHISYLNPSRAYCHVQTPPPEQPGTFSPANPDALISIPLQQYDSHFGLLVNTWAPLWRIRHMLSIPQGVSFSAGQFTIRIGDVRSTRTGTQTANVLSPGVLVCITTTIGTGQDDDNQPSNHEAPSEGAELDLDEAQEMIRALWRAIKEGKDLGKSEAREFMMEKDNFGPQGNVEKRTESHVRMWCEVLRLRGLDPYWDVAAWLESGAGEALIL